MQRNESPNTGFYEYTKDETPNKQFRRSLYVINDIEKGETFTPYNVRSIRPGFGLEPKFFKEVLNKKAAHSIKKGTALNWTMIS